MLNPYINQLDLFMFQLVGLSVKNNTQKLLKSYVCVKKE